MSTIKEVSELAGVSLATVSRVMNGSDRVKESTKVKVREAMEALGYQPNSAAQSLASNRTNTIGMVVAWLDGPFYGPVMSGVEEELRKYNKHVIIAAGHGTPEQEQEAVNYLKARQVDGLILLTESLDKEYLNGLSEQLPIYLINQHHDGLESRNMWLDNEGGGYAATRHLIEQGHTDIVCISGQRFKQDARERVLGYKRAMKEFGLKFTAKNIVHSIFDIGGGLKAMEQLETNGVKFTAVAAGSDEMAIGVYEWAEQKGLRVPDQLSVIGFDNQSVANYVSPKLTTMDYPAYEMAKACARMAVDEIYNKKQPHGLEFKPSLVVRQSVKAKK
jgi:LacI family transcriptional regulator